MSSAPAFARPDESSRLNRNDLRATWFESLLVVAGLVGVFAFAVALRGSNELFTRPLWLDEYHTWLVATDPSFSHAMAALRRGADFNPPGYYLLLRGYTAITGPLTEVSLRAFSLGLVVLGLLGVYRLLRISFVWWVALAATLAAASHPLLVHHAFDGRFYAPWFATTAWLCLLLSRPVADRPSIRSTVGVVILSALMCSIHYFGIMVLTLIAGTHLVFQARGVGSWRRTLLGLAAGPATLALLIPFFYFGQKAALTVPTWIGPPIPGKVLAFLDEIFLLSPFGMAAMVAAGTEMLRRRTSGVASAAGADRSLLPMFPVMSLTLLPLVIIAFSYLIQPSTLSRYSLPSVLCVGPIVAVMLERTRRRVVILACTGLIGGFAMQVRTEHNGIDYFRDDLRQEIAAIERDNPGHRLIVSPVRRPVLTLWHYAPALRDRVRMLDLSGEFQGIYFNFHRLERDVAFRLSELYDTPKVVTRDELSAADSFYLVAPRDDADFAAARFPNHDRTVLASDRWVVLRLTARTPPDANRKPASDGQASP